MYIKMQINCLPGENICKCSNLHFKDVILERGILSFEYLLDISGTVGAEKFVSSISLPQMARVCDNVTMVAWDLF